MRTFGRIPVIRCGCEDNHAARWKRTFVLSRLARRLLFSDLNSLCNRESVFEFNAKVSDRAVHLGMAEKKLDGSQVPGFLVDLSDLCSPHGMGSICARLKADRRDPVSDNPRVLSR